MADRRVEPREWWREVRIALRRLARTPGWTALVTLTLAFGVAGTSGVAELALLALRPLPFSAAHELVAVWETRRGMRRWVAPANYLDWRRESESFAGLAAHDTRGASVTVEGVASRERVVDVSGNFFDVLGVEPSEGRTFDPAFDPTFPAREAVLALPAARGFFGGAREAIGRTLLVDEVAYTVVGVAPPQTTFPEAGLFAWLRSPSEAPEARGAPIPTGELRDAWYFEVVGRLAPGVELGAARAEMESIALGLARIHPDTNADAGVVLTPLVEQTVADFGTVVLTLGAAVVLLLAASLLNVIHLTRARAVERRADTAVRIALGASRGRLVRGRLLEGCALGLTGGATGALLAAYGLLVAREHLSARLPGAADLGLGFGGCLTAFVLSVVTGCLIAGVGQAGSTRDTGLRARMGSLRDGGALIGAQVALSVAVLSGVVLLSATFLRLGAVDLGFRAEGLETLRIALPDAPSRSYEERIAVYRHVAAAVQGLGGVESVAFGANGPLEQGLGAGVRIVGGGPEGEPPNSGWQPVTPGYFRTLGIELRAGRTFDEGDRADTRHVAVVNESFARTVFPGRDPLGLRVTMGLDGHDRPLTIVGIVGDTRTAGPAVEPGPVLYRPIEQTDRFAAGAVFLAARRGPGGDPGAIERAAATAGPGLPRFDVRSGEQLVAPFRASQALMLTIMAAFGVTAVALGAVGAFGVGLHAVRRRRLEIGVRLALGATERRITVRILGGGLRSALYGVGPGVLLALALGRAMESLLFGVSADDLRVPAAAALAVLVLIMLSLLVPARIGAATDPVTSIRTP